VTTLDDAIFAEAIQALQPRLGGIVVVGGWAHRLHRLHPSALANLPQSLRTDDLDIATPNALSNSETPIDVLLRSADFTETFTGTESPPISRWMKDKFKIEFLADLRGSSEKRGKLDATVLVAGITAQKLRQVGVLLIDPWTVRLDGTTDPPIPNGAVEVRIANPTSYITQKILTMDDRKHGKRAKDILYVYDTVRAFAGGLGSLNRIWRDSISGQLPPATRKKISKNFDSYFSDGGWYLMEAARIAKATGRAESPSEKEISLACHEALQIIFDDVWATRRSMASKPPSR